MSTSSASLNYNKTTHILNGDALREFFPAEIATEVDGEIIVARECLIDGDVQGDSFEEFMANRAAVIGQYPDCTPQQYLQTTVPEFSKIRALTIDDTVVCWFEEDLFCQINFWYVCYLLTRDSSAQQVFLVRPNSGNEYSFAHMSALELLDAFQNKARLSEQQLEHLANLWLAYQQKNWQQLAQIGDALNSEFGFIKAAVQAQLDRLPDASGLGLPERELLAIMRAQQNLSFASAFQEFYQAMAIYSFGDLQVKAMYDRLLPLV